MLAILVFFITLSCCCVKASPLFHDDRSKRNVADSASKATLDLFNRTFSVLPRDCQDPFEIDQVKRLAEVAMNKINKQLGTDFRIHYIHDRLPSERCVPSAGMRGPMLCNDFFEMIAQMDKSEDQEAAMAYVIAHEIMHGYRENGYGIATRHVARLAKELELDEKSASILFYGLEHQNVDWGATKVMKACQYQSIEPGIRYLDQLRKKMPKENTLEEKITEDRVHHLRQSFQEGLTKTQAHRHTTGFCAVFVNSSQPWDDEKQRLRKLTFNHFLTKHFKKLPPELGDDCQEYPYSEIKDEMARYLKRIGYTQASSGERTL